MKTAIQAALLIFGFLFAVYGGMMWYAYSYNAALCSSGSALATADQCNTAVEHHQLGIILFVIGAILFVIAFLPFRRAR